MKWKDDYATGIQRIDEQHKSLFRMADDYRLALDEGSGERTYETLLAFLDSFSKGHFRFEERCMEQYRCPVAHENKEAHARFLETLRDFQHRYATSGFRAADAHDLIDGIEQWLSSHICRIDICLRNREET